jgi:hypothetical protein
VHIELDQRTVADAREAVDLTSLDHEDVAGARLELLAVHDPEALDCADCGLPNPIPYNAVCHPQISAFGPSLAFSDLRRKGVVDPSGELF